MTIYYLMVKTHNITGLKYLCQTKRNDPYRYLGSGKYWKSHLKKHGKNIHTEILKECVTKDDLQEWGLYYSNLWGVVDSADWANLRPETGDGGRTVYGVSHHMKTEKYKRHLKETVWTPEKRKVQGENSKISNNLRDKIQVSVKLQKAWNDSRKLAHQQRMHSNNPMQSIKSRKKLSDNNGMHNADIVQKISGDNHYKRKLNFVQTQAGHNHPKFNKTLYTFYNKLTGVTEISVVFDLQQKYNLNQGNLSLLVSGKRKSVAGWTIVR